MKAAVVVLLLALVGMALANKICDPDLITAINKGSHNWQAGTYRFVVLALLRCAGGWPAVGGRALGRRGLADGGGGGGG